MGYEKSYPGLQCGRLAGPAPSHAPALKLFKL